MFCSDVRQTRMLATQPICYLTSLCVLPEEKFAPNFRACIIVKNQYFYGWKKKYPPLKDVQLEKEKEKKKAFCTPFLMFDENMNTFEECSIYL